MVHMSAENSFSFKSIEHDVKELETAGNRAVTQTAVVEGTVYMGSYQPFAWWVRTSFYRKLYQVVSLVECYR